MPVTQERHRISEFRDWVIVRFEWVWPFCDYVFPMATPRTSVCLEEERVRTREQIEKDIQIICGQLPWMGGSLTVNDVESLIERTFNLEADRRKYVENKLAMLLAYGTAVSSLIVPGIVAIISGKLLELESFDGGFRILIVVLLSYISMQFLLVTMNATKGLKRTESLVITPEGLVDSMTHVDIEERVESAVEAYYDAIKTNNVKVTYMAIAHTAVENALRGFAVLVAVLLMRALLTFCLDYQTIGTFLILCSALLPVVVTGLFVLRQD